jgi:hypothetical protein
MYAMLKSEVNCGENNAELIQASACASLSGTLAEQTSTCASLAGTLADVDDGSDFRDIANNEVIEINDDCLEDWNPFNGVTAADGYAYCGKLAFICLGQVSMFYCKILKTGGGNTKNKEERKKNACSSICKVQENTAAMERAVGSERGMSVQTKVSYGFLAQNEDNADQQHADWWLMATIKQIESESKTNQHKNENDGSNGGWRIKEAVFMSITSLMDKVEQLNEELALLGNKKRSTNPIVDRVLLHGAESMGLKDRGTKTSGEEDSDYVVDILKE